MSARLTLYASRLFSWLWRDPFPVSVEEVVRYRREAAQWAEIEASAFMRSCYEEAGIPYPPREP